jgi:hypothetical protein
MLDASDGSNVPAESEMPMLAGSAAARLTQQILARLSSPHAVPSASPLRPGALWRQVARRLGVMPDERPRPGPGRQLLPAVQTQEQPRTAQEHFAPPPAQLVWRTVSPARQVHEDEVGGEDLLASALRPATRVVPPSPPQATPPVVATPTVPMPVASAPVVASAPQSSFVQPSLAEAVQAPALSIPEAAPSSQVVDSAPSAPAKTVVVEYLPGPAALPVQPLVSHTPLIETSSYTPRNIAGSLNRDLVPTTDMISRMERPSWEDLPLPGERQSAQTPAPALEQTPPPQPEQPQQVTPSVVQAALPVEEAPRLEMPLAATTATSQRAPSRTTEEILERAERGPVRQLIDRVASALPLPDAVRRFITGEPAPAEKQPTPIPAETPVEAIVAAEREAPHIGIQAQAPQPVPTAASPVQPAPSATSGDQQPSTPSLAARAERVSQDIVSAPSPASTPSALEMPVRAPSAPAGQVPESQQTHQASPPLGPFQPFQASQLAQPAMQARSVEQVQQPQEPPAERAVQLQPTQAAEPQQSQPLGPFEPFRPAQPVVAEQARPATELVPPSPRSAHPAVPSVVEPLPEASASSTPTQAPVGTRDEQVAQVPVGVEAPAVSSVARETTATPESEPRGFLGSVLDRLFGRGERTEVEGSEQSEPRTPAIQMPWVRQGRSPQTQPGKLHSTDIGDVELPSTRVAEPGRQAAQGVTTALTPSTPAATPSLASASPPPPQQAPPPVPEQTAPVAQPVEPPPSQATMPVQVEVETESAPPVSVSRQASEIAVPQAYAAPQAEHIPGAQVDDHPDLPRVLELNTSPSQPAPLDMPHAAQPVQSDLPLTTERADDLIQMATLPSEAVVRPTIETPAEMPTPPVPEFVLAPAAPEAVQVRQPEPEAPQAWTFMPDVADSLVRSHAPLSTVQPIETAAQSDLLARILGSLGHEISAAATSDDLPRAVPAPATGAGTNPPVARPSGSVQPEGVVAETTPVVRPAPAISTSMPSGAPMPTPIGLSANPIVGGPQVSFGGSTSASATTPEPVAMPPRYVTNVTPASYIAESAVANIPAESGLSDIGTIMRPASHMSPSMGDYGWPGSDGSSSSPTLMLPLSEMSPTADGFAQSEAGSGDQSLPTQDEQPPWMSALQSLYGQQSNDDMPLAVPYGAFAVPSESASTWQAPGFGQSHSISSPARAASDGFSPMAMPTPSVPYFGSDSSAQSFAQPSSFVTSTAPSWSTDSMGPSGFSSWSTDSYSEGDSEAGAWADVVASAVSSDSGSSPALALAAEERSSSSSSSSSSASQPENTQDGGHGAGPELDELAESVLDIIRHKLLVERERNFG